MSDLMILGLPDGIVFALVCVVVLPLSLLAAYLHSSRLGWDPKENH